MLTAVVTRSGEQLQVKIISAAPVAEEATSEVAAKEPNPIAIEPKELAWTAGSFLILMVIMRYFLFPRLKKGMNDRYSAIRSNIEGADQVKASARADVAEYESALVAARAEAATRIDAARQTLDTERTARLVEVNSRIATARAEADAATSAARAAAQGQVATAVATVVVQATELATGSKPDAATVDQAVKAVMESSATR
jgi:F-type H+-transporting ATPase subunit b